jgi:hypothetical protein
MIERKLRLAAVACLLAVAALIGCATGSSNQVVYATGKGSVTPDGLHLVKWEPFRSSFVKPGARLSDYDKVMIDAVSVSYKRPPVRRSLEGNFTLSDHALASLRKAFRKAFTDELTRGTFSLVTAPGPDVLRISGHIVDLVVSVPDFESQDPSETIMTASPGTATLVLDVRDSQSGEPLVRVGQRASASLGDNAFNSSDPVANSAAVRQLFRGWAEKLTRELNKLHSLPEIPLPAGS